MDIGKRIKQLRIENEYTQKELADKIGLTPKMISFYENEERVPPIDIVLKLIIIFGVTSDYLLGISDDRQNPEDYEWRYSHEENRLGKILSNYRRKNNLSQKDFSKLLNITEELEMQIEIGIHTPSWKLIKKISDITKYEVDFITGASDKTHIPNAQIEIDGIFYNCNSLESNELFHSRLEELCLKEGVNSINAEEHLGLTKQEFFDIQWNRMPTLSELLRISYGFGVSMDYLIGKTDLRLSSLNKNELELILNYRDCLPKYKKNIFKRAQELSIESIQEPEKSSVAADHSSKKTGTDNMGK